jgi:predicted ATPase/DNA-binding winged helix-turn-helix (wHTH) protein
VSDFSHSFGPFRLNPARRILTRDGKPLRLGSRALDLLIALVESGDNLISKEDLLKRVWPDTYIEEANLRVHIAALRKLLGDEGSGDQYIGTVAGRGYCFLAPVTRLDESAGSAMTAPAQPATETVRPVPASITRVIGRSEAIANISTQLARRRFVTIVGPGGIGKTTVALAVVGHLAESYPHPVCFVELASLSDPRLIPGALASVLGLATFGDRPVSTLVAYLQNKSLLIVLDNCEHALDAVAALAESLLRGAPGIHVLATSRQPLRGEGEFVYHITALAVPPPEGRLSISEALGFSAVELFSERAAASLDSFELTGDNVATVVEICRRLDGIPLAIELAAARVDLFGVEGLATRLNDCFSVLTKGRRTALPRHQTLRATLDWSFELLSNAEKAVLARLSILVGEFTMETAIALGSESESAPAGLVDAITSLIEKSLVATDLGGNVVHYRMLGTTRVYAMEKLVLNGEAGAMARRHATYFREFAQKAEADWKTLTASQWLSIYGRTIDDMRLAIDWAFSEDGELAVGLDITIATAPLWFQLSLMDEYRERLLKALECVAKQPAADLVREVRLRIALGHAVWYSANDADRMQDAFARALEIAEEIDDRSAQLQSLWGIWAMLRSRGAYNRALEVAKRYEEVAIDFGDPQFISLANRILSVNHHYLGHQEVALRLVANVQSQATKSGLQKARSANHDFQLDRGVAITTLLARINWLQGFPDQAAARAREAIEAALATRHVLSLGYALCMAGCPIALWNGDLSEGARCNGLLREYAARNGLYSSWGECYEQVMGLRAGTEKQILTAAFVEPRIDVSTIARLTQLDFDDIKNDVSAEKEPPEAMWSYPEILRVDAELLLYVGSTAAEKRAEKKLLQSLELSRVQTLLSFELRTAMSLARLWSRTKREAKARDLLQVTHDRFTEGFATDDLTQARDMLKQMS